MVRNGVIIGSFLFSDHLGGVSDQLGDVFDHFL
jgi:hypothetical protein